MVRFSLAALAGALISTTALAADPLVSADWLSDRLGQEDLVVLDIRNRIDGGSAEAFADGHIPGAVYSNYLEDGWRAEVNGTPGMLPPVEDLEALIGGLGIDNDDHVVIVSGGTSSSDFGSASRVYWTFQVLGHQDLSILEGGHAGWVDAGLELESGTADPEGARYVADFQPGLIASRDEVVAASQSGATPLVDARPVAQYTGAEAPGNVGIPGTIPGAVSLPNDRLLSEDGRNVIGRDQLAAYLDEIGLDGTGEQIAFCNTGHWASVSWFLLNEVGGNDAVRLYDGSMVDYTAADLPLEVGADTVLN